MMEILIVSIAVLIGLFLAYRASKLLDKNKQKESEIQMAFLSDLSAALSYIIEIKDYTQVTSNEENKDSLDQLERDLDDVLHRIDEMRNNHVKHP